MIPLYVDLPDSRIFTLFFPSLKKNAPVLLYNPGGPGSSSISGILSMYSPLIFDYFTGKVSKNSGIFNLTERFNLIGIDVPANTGYSLIKKTPEEYGDPTTLRDYVIVLKTLLQQFKQYVGEKPVLDFFGFSYAGKILPLVAERMSKDGYKIGGLAIFSGYTDPLRQEIRPLMEYLYYMGLLTSTEYNKYEKITNDIEKMLLSGADWRQVQDLYGEVGTMAWEAASADTFDTKLPSTVENPLDKPLPDEKEDEEQEMVIDIYFNNPAVMKAIGANTPFSDQASMVDPITYKGFLQPATDALKYLADKGVLIFYVMGTMDGATLARGTEDMMEYLFSTKIDGSRWFVMGEKYADSSLSGKEDASSYSLVGKISKIRPNVYYAVIIGSGHSMESKEGFLATAAVLDALSQGKGLV